MFSLQATPNLYNVRGIAPLTPRPPTVRFNDVDPLIPPPDSRYLRLHAACAKVARLSGAADYIETLNRRVEETCVLATDGSSVDLLSYALASIVKAP